MMLSEVIEVLIATSIKIVYYVRNINVAYN
jgi:hypothetical protein